MSAPREPFPSPLPPGGAERSKPRIAGSGAGYQIIARPETFHVTAAAFLERKLRALGDASTISLALSGGSTPGPIYARLAEATALPWDRAEVFFADERAVPPDDPESNYRLARERLLDHVPIADERVHRMPAERPDLEVVAREYESCLPDRLDLLVLGIGTDGHTASLFPDSPAVRESERRVLPSEAPEPPHRRLTLTPPAILSARLVVMLGRGAAKKAAVRCALGDAGSPERCPARLARRGVWILDREAADP